MSKKVETVKHPEAGFGVSEVKSMISEAAYYKAQARNFEGDLALKDWLEAESEIEMMLSKAGSESKSLLVL